VSSLLLSGCSDPKHHKHHDFQSGVAALVPADAGQGGLSGQVHIFTSSNRRQTLQWNLSGVDPRCGGNFGDLPTGRCGIHIRTADTCDGNNEGTGLAAKGTLGNPWLPVHYFAHERTSIGYYSEVESGLSAQELHGHSLVVTDAFGNSLACGLVCTLPSVALPTGKSALACSNAAAEHATTTEIPHAGASKVGAATSSPGLKQTTPRSRETTIVHSHSATQHSTTKEPHTTSLYHGSTQQASTEASHKSRDIQSTEKSTTEPVVVKSSKREHHSRSKERSTTKTPKSTSRYTATQPSGSSTQTSTSKERGQSKPARHSTSAEASRKSTGAPSATSTTAVASVVRTTKHKSRGNKPSTTEPPDTTSMQHHLSTYHPHRQTHVSTTAGTSKSKPGAASTSTEASPKSNDAHSATTAEPAVVRSTPKESRSKTKEHSTSTEPYTTEHHTSKERSASKTQASTTIERRQAPSKPAKELTSADASHKSHRTATSSTIAPVVVGTTSEAEQHRKKAHSTSAPPVHHSQAEHHSTSIAPETTSEASSGERHAQTTGSTRAHAVEVAGALVGFGWIACMWCCGAFSTWRVADCQELSIKEQRLGELNALVGVLSVGTFLMLLPACTCGSEWNRSMDSPLEQEIWRSGNQFLQVLGMVWALLWFLLRLRAFLLRYDKKPPPLHCTSPLWRLLPEAIWIYTFSSTSSVLFAADDGGTDESLRLLSIPGLLALYDWQVYATAMKCRPYHLHSETEVLKQPLVDEALHEAPRTSMMMYVVAPAVGVAELVWKPSVALVAGWSGCQEGSAVNVAATFIAGCCMAGCAGATWRVSSRRVCGIAVVAGLGAAFTAVFTCGGTHLAVASNLSHLWMRLLYNVSAGLALLVAAVAIAAFMAWMDHHPPQTPRSVAPVEEAQDAKGAMDEPQASEVGRYTAPMLPEEDGTAAPMVITLPETETEARPAARAVAHVPREQLLVLGRSQSTNPESMPAQTEAEATGQLSVAAKREAIAAVKLELESCKDALKKAQRAHGQELLAKDQYVRELQGAMTRSQAELAEITDVMTTRVAAMKGAKELSHDQVAARDMRIRELESDLTKLHRLVPLPASQSSQEREENPTDHEANV